jgi:hypothetical protein
MINDITPKASPMHRGGIVLPIEQKINSSLSQQRNIIMGEEADEDEEDDTQYLSQPASSVCNETLNDNSSCQIYLTPTGSWQTLTNLNYRNTTNPLLSNLMSRNEEIIRIDINNSHTNGDETPIQQLTPILPVNNNLTTPGNVNRSYVVASDMDDNKTDLDEQEDFEDYADENLHRHSSMRSQANNTSSNNNRESYEDDDNVSETTTIYNSREQAEVKSVDEDEKKKMAVDENKDDLIYTKTTMIVREMDFLF